MVVRLRLPELPARDRGEGYGVILEPAARCVAITRLARLRLLALCRTVGLAVFLPADQLQIVQQDRLVRLAVVFAFAKCRATIAEALTLGTSKLSVDGVVLIGEHQRIHDEGGTEKGENQLEEARPDDDTTVLRRQLLHLQFNMANVLRDLARYTEAHLLDQQVLAEQRNLLPQQHAQTLMTSSGTGETTHSWAAKAWTS